MIEEENYSSKKSSADGIKARYNAITMMNRWLETGDFPDRMFGSIPAVRRGFVMDLLYTTVRNYRLLDHIATQFIEKTPNNTVMSAILLGLCQIFKMPQMADYAAVHATVEALKHTGNAGAVGFVNAVLRSALRKSSSIAVNMKLLPLPIAESHIDEQVERWEKRFGAEKTRALCEWDNLPASVTVVTVPRGPSVEELSEMFKSVGVETLPHETSPENCLVLPHGSHIDMLPGFADGKFAIQDPVTLKAVELLDVKPGMRVLDACAAPGGKAVQAALRLNGQGVMFASDCWTDRLDTLHENLSRFALSDFVKVARVNAKTMRLSDFDGKKFDRILLDVPCSNTGVQRRRADAKWRFSASRLAELNKTQFEILQSASMLLNKGGRIVYSTCSLEEEENEKIVEKFLKKNKDFVLVGENFSMPVDSKTDGAYAAALEYRNS